MTRTFFAYFMILFFLFVQHAPAQKKPVQKWSGTITYEEKSELTKQDDSTWMHATAKGTPVSHNKRTIKAGMNATFTLIRDNPDIVADIDYSHFTSTDIRSEATVLCRRPNTKPYYTALSRNFFESTDIIGNGKAPAQVTVSVNQKTGMYTISVNAPEIPAKVTFNKNQSETVDCGSKQEPPASPALPPVDTNTPAVSAKASGQVDPKNPNVLIGSAPVGEKATLKWNLNAEPYEEPQAIHGPYSATRGDDVTLDGSRSKGKNLTYEWTFAPQCAGGPNDRVRLTGPTVKVKLLCTTDIRLKVSDGDQTDAKTATAEIKARNWGATEVTHEPKKYFDDKTTMSTEFHTVHFSVGGNRCAEHGTREEGEGHYMHPTLSEGWEDVVYTVKQVTDGGPFDGLFYVDKGPKKLHVKRVSWINSDLLPSSAMARENAKAQKTAKDFTTLGKQVEEHERIHTTLLEEAIKENDPLKSIEYQVGLSKEDLNNKVLVQLVNAENKLRDAGLNEQEVKVRVKKKQDFNRPGMVLVPMADGSGQFGEWNIPNFADLGDD